MSTQPEKKKRGRKPKDTSKQKKKTNNTESNIILHLPINNKFNTLLQEDKLLTYNPKVEIPVPNQTMGLNHKFSNVEFINKNEKNIFENSVNEIIPTAIDNQLDENLIEDNDYLTDTNILLNVNENKNEDENKNKNQDEEEDIVLIKKQNISISHEENWYDKNTDNDNFSYDMYNLIKKRKEELEINTFDANSIETQHILKQFKESNKTKWPKRTSIYCWWCCHPFNNPPCAIPHKIVNDTYHVYGVFCSPECAAAYNFNESHVKIYERYSLLNLLYKNIYDDPNLKIKLAHDRRTLKIFGGSLNIQEFRKSNSNNEKEFKIIDPPMISIIPQQEYNFTDKFVSSFNKKKVNCNINKNLVLKRSKPVFTKNTIEACLK